mmetsp:Transcript_52053/g.156202  ORF Transcript_52053/g.156202 Transcript_52053/m.156202 type:complete len:447 (+) Transcript_52053:319-1659(+)
MPLQWHAPHIPVITIVKLLHLCRIRSRNELEHLHSFLAGRERIRPCDVGEARPMRSDDSRRPAEHVELHLEGEDVPPFVAAGEEHQLLLPAVAFHGRTDRRHDVLLVPRVQEAAVLGVRRGLRRGRAVAEAPCPLPRPPPSRDDSPGVVHDRPLLEISLGVVLRDPVPQVLPQRVPHIPVHLALIGHCQRPILDGNNLIGLVPVHPLWKFRVDKMNQAPKCFRVGKKEDRPVGHDTPEPRHGWEVVMQNVAKIWGEETCMRDDVNTSQFRRLSALVEFPVLLMSCPSPRSITEKFDILSVSSPRTALDFVYAVDTPILTHILPLAAVPIREARAGRERRHIRNFPVVTPPRGGGTPRHFHLVLLVRQHLARAGVVHDAVGERVHAGVILRFDASALDAPHLQLLESPSTRRRSLLHLRAKAVDHSRRTFLGRLEDALVGYGGVGRG